MKCALFIKYYFNLFNPIAFDNKQTTYFFYYGQGVNNVTPALNSIIESIGLIGAVI